MIRGMTIEDLTTAYKEKKISPIDVTKEQIKRIKNSQYQLNAFITITEDVSLQQADLAERKIMYDEDLGRLHGVPFSYKDLIYTKNIRTTSGSYIDRNFIPKENAPIVKQLTEEGAINLGKTNMYEYAFDITSENPFYGDTKNPWDINTMAGGSSGGAAVALAANLSMATIGTDTGGSIRIPAACCGIVGLKPTYGLVDNRGIMPVAKSLDHAGPMTRNMTDLALMMEVLTGKNYQMYCGQNIKGLRIGVPMSYIDPSRVDPEVMTLFEKALQHMEKLGAILIDVDMSFVKDTLEVIFTIARAESGYVHEENIKSSLDQYSAEVKELLKASHSITYLDYRKAVQKKEKLTKQVSDLFHTVDVLAMPTQPKPATRLGETHVAFNGEKELLYNAMTRFTRLFDITGHPAISIPCGLTNTTLPVGLQLVAHHQREDLLIKLSYAYEQDQLLDFYEKRDDICLVL